MSLVKLEDTVFVLNSMLYSTLSLDSKLHVFRLARFLLNEENSRMEIEVSIKKRNGDEENVERTGWVGRVIQD